MNTKLLMTSSAIALGAAGIMLTFAPDYAWDCLHLEINKPLLLLMQIVGALYVAFGLLNWMTRKSLVGGIYNRPIASANFTHFFIAGLALIKGLISNLQLPLLIWTAGMAYLLFAILFGMILFQHPKKNKAI